MLIQVRVQLEHKMQSNIHCDQTDSLQQTVANMTILFLYTCSPLPKCRSSKSMGRSFKFVEILIREDILF